MMEHFKIGTEWRTLGGWRAVVVQSDANGVMAYHDCTPNHVGLVALHQEDGGHRLSYTSAYHERAEYFACTDFDLIDGWHAQDNGKVATA